ncbi:MAG: sugar phosphate isomerase/epimerase [Opitutaceae bacterium]|nr:sugar phosphate isomerase/epimerase [Opitutaceae bacterium]
MLRRTFSSLGCPELDLDGALALVAKHGLEGAELRVLGGTVDLPAYFTAQFGSPAALVAKLGAESRRIVALDTSLKLIGNTPEEREQFLQFLPWAEALGVPRLRVFDGGSGLDETTLAQAVDTVRWWQAMRRERGWRADLMVETHDSLANAAAIRRFAMAAPGCAVLWDSQHTWLRGGEDPLVTWAAIRDLVVHVHVKDSIDVPSAKHSWTYVLPGTGRFPIAPLLAALRADAFAGPVSLEWERLWHPYLPTLDAALTAATQNRWW